MANSKAEKCTPGWQAFIQPPPCGDGVEKKGKKNPCMEAVAVWRRKRTLCCGVGCFSERPPHKWCLQFMENKGHMWKSEQSVFFLLETFYREFMLFRLTGLRSGHIFAFCMKNVIFCNFYQLFDVASPVDLIDTFGQHIHNQKIFPEILSHYAALAA